MSHKRTEHPRCEEVLRTEPTSSQIQVVNFFDTRCATNYNSWLNYTVNCLHPFSHVEKEVIPRSVKFSPMLIHTFMLFLPRLTKKVEKKIEDTLPSSFPLVFDGLTAHYLCFFARTRAFLGFTSREMRAASMRMRILRF